MSNLKANPKTETVFLRLTPAQMKALKKAYHQADFPGKNLQAYVRKLIFKALKMEAVLEDS